jgi:hypothetical protein
MKISTITTLKEPAIALIARARYSRMRVQAGSEKWRSGAPLAADEEDDVGRVGSSTLDLPSLATAVSAAG